VLFCVIVGLAFSIVEGVVPDTPPTWRDIVEIARWTPSPHNTQPWRLHAIDPFTAELAIVRARMLPDEDTTGCFIRCAMGMFLESISIIANRLGWRLETTGPRSRDTNGTIAFARLTLSPLPDGVGADEFTAQDILDRRTSRLTPDAAVIADEHLRALAARGAGHGLTLTWTSDPSMIAPIMEANLGAVCHDLNDPKYGTEIRNWFRVSAGHARRTRDGLDALCMNIPRHELALISIAPWLLRWTVSRTPMRRMYARRIGPVHQLAFLSGAFFDPADAAPAAGRALMRLWLAMHRMAIGIHPFGNLVTNPAAHARLTSITGTSRIWLVFRIGRTELPPRSLRLESKDILCSTG